MKRAFLIFLVCAIILIPVVSASGTWINPVMTSNADPAGIANASTENTASSRYAWRAMDHDNSSSNFWATSPSHPKGWIQYRFEMGPNHTALQRLQWVMPMPADWNAGALTAIIGWTCTGTAGGTVKWILKGYLVGDDGTLNATLGTLASVTDTFLAANDLHVTAETSLGTPGGSGNLLLLELIRDYANDTDTDAALFVSLRLKYGRTI